MRARQAAIFLISDVVFVLVFVGLYVFDAHAKDTLIPQIFVPIGLVLVAVGAIGLLRSRRSS